MQVAPAQQSAPAPHSKPGFTQHAADASQEQLPDDAQNPASA
jgi:hypothetical protein